LGAVGFVEERRNTSSMSKAEEAPLLVLPQTADPLNLSLGLSILSSIQAENWECNLDRQLRLFDKEVALTIETPKNATQNEILDEDLKKSDYLRLTPNDPGGINCVKISITFGSSKGQSLGGTRNFSSDDTLLDILHWLSGLHGSAIYRKLVSGQWVVVDLDKKEGDEGREVIIVKGEEGGEDDRRGWTLMRMGMWPSARLGVRAGREI
jgi:hypothetical protein